MMALLDAATKDFGCRSGRSGIRQRTKIIAVDAVGTTYQNPCNIRL